MISDPTDRPQKEAAKEHAFAASVFVVNQPSGNPGKWPVPPRSGRQLLSFGIIMLQTDGPGIQFSQFQEPQGQSQHKGTGISHRAGPQSALRPQETGQDHQCRQQKQHLTGQRYQGSLHRLADGAELSLWNQAFPGKADRPEPAQIDHRQNTGYDLAQHRCDGRAGHPPYERQR